MRALAAIKSVGNGHRLSGGISHHHNIALIEVDLEARHLLEAKKEELEVGDVHLRAFDHDDRVVSILEDGDSRAPREVGGNTSDVARGFSPIGSFLPSGCLITSVSLSFCSSSTEGLQAAGARRRELLFLLH